MQHKVGVRTGIIVVNPGNPRHASVPYITVHHTVVMAKLDSGEQSLDLLGNCALRELANI